MASQAQGTAKNVSAMLKHVKIMKKQHSRLQKHASCERPLKIFLWSFGAWHFPFAIWKI